MLVFLSRVERIIFELAVSKLKKCFSKTEGVREETRLKFSYLNSVASIISWQMDSNSFISTQKQILGEFLNVP